MEAGLYAKFTSGVPINVKAAKDSCRHAVCAGIPFPDRLISVLAKPAVSPPVSRAILTGTCSSESQAEDPDRSTTFIDVCHVRKTEIRTTDKLWLAGVAGAYLVMGLVVVPFLV